MHAITVVSTRLRPLPVSVFRALPLVVALVLALAACGSSDTASNSTGAQDSAEVESAASQDEDSTEGEDDSTNDREAEDTSDSNDNDPDESTDDSAEGAAAAGDTADGDSADDDDAATDTAGESDPDAIPPLPSAGCSTSSPTPNPEQMQPLQVGDTARAYFVTVPPTADNRPLPLIIDFHGYSSGARVHTVMSELSGFGATEGFVTVTPQGSGPVPLWNFTKGSEDLALVGALLDQLEESSCIDTNRVFAAGLSNGAFLTSAIACEYSDRLAAVATVAGMFAIDGCEPDRPVPVVAFHGTADTFVSFEGGFGASVADLPSADGTSTIGETTGAGTQSEITETGDTGETGETGGSEATDTSTTADEGAEVEAPPTSVDSTVTTNAELSEVLVESDNAPSIPELAELWAERNGCDPTVATTEVARTESDESIELLAWDECDNDAEVQLYVIEGGGHSWPGSEFSASLVDLVGPTTSVIDANVVMWEFFQNHPMMG